MLFETLRKVDGAMAFGAAWPNANYCVQKVRHSNRSMVTLEHIVVHKQQQKKSHIHDDQISRICFFFSLNRTIVGESVADINLQKKNIYKELLF